MVCIPDCIKLILAFLSAGITENCRKLYQPAAAAEERHVAFFFFFFFFEFVFLSTDVLYSRRFFLLIMSRFKNKMASGDKSIPNDQQSRLARFEKGDELLSQQEENRIAQEAEKLERTRKKVEEMWQSLE